MVRALSVPAQDGDVAAGHADFRAITDAIALVAGGEILYFCSPGRALAAKSLPPAVASQIVGSAYIPTDQQIGVAVNAFVRQRVRL
jgi:hypothetical protein